MERVAVGERPDLDRPEARAFQSELEAPRREHLQVPDIDDGGARAQQAHQRMPIVVRDRHQRATGPQESPRGLEQPIGILHMLERLVGDDQREFGLRQALRIEALDANHRTHIGLRRIRRRTRRLYAQHLRESKRPKVREKRAVPGTDLERRAPVGQLAETRSQRPGVALRRVSRFHAAVVARLGIGTRQGLRRRHARGVEQIAPRTDHHAQAHVLRFLARRVRHRREPPGIGPLREALLRLVGIAADGAGPRPQHARTV